jgi:hypothetical protein
VPRRAASPLGRGHTLGSVRQGPRLLLGRLLALVQGVIWLATLSGTALRVGWVFGLLALAAAVAARRMPGRSAMLILAPALFEALIALPYLAGSRPGLGFEGVTRLSAETLPGICAGLIIWTARTTEAPERPRVASLRARSISIRRATSAAVVLALLSIVPVAVSFGVPPSREMIANERWAAPPIDWQLIEPLHGLVLATVTTLVAAVVGGLAGGLAWRRGPIWGGVAALAGAWATAITVLPLVAAGLGVHLRTGIICLFGCQASLRDDQPFGGPAAYAEFVLGTAVLVWPIIALAAVVTVVLTVVPSLRPPGPGNSADTAGTSPRGLLANSRLLLVLSLGGFALVHGAGIALMSSSNQTGLIPYLCLCVGVVVRAAWLDRSAARSRAAQEAPLS